MAAGRPQAFKNPEQLNEAIEGYFVENQSPTVSGLAYHLGFESRQSFYDYEKTDKFSYTIKRARLKIESHYESRLQGSNPAGSIFWLKNHKWTDKQEVEHSGTVTTKVFKIGDKEIPFE